MKQQLTDDVKSTDQMIGNMDQALNNLEGLEQMIELKKKNNVTLAKMVEDLANED